MRDGLPLEVVDGLTLEEPYRRVLRPGALVADGEGRLRRLPRWFYRVPDWDVALETRLTPNFAVWELLNVDVREHELLRAHWPRYLPCAVALLAAHLELLRVEVGTYVHVAANGGYRSPGHRLSGRASTHCWGTAANLYRIGDEFLDERRTLQKYRQVVERLMPGVFVRPIGPDRDEADDHLHLDLGFTVAVPRGVEGEPAEADDGRSQRVENAAAGA